MVNENFFVEVVEVDAVQEHENADKLELAIVKGWQIVVKKGQFQAGDIAVHIPPNAVIPEEVSDEWGVTQYLSKQRVRVARLRGEPSYGFLVANETNAPLGTDLKEHYGITEYEPPEQFVGGDQDTMHPLFTLYASIQNLYNFPTILKDGEEVICTEKVHGCLHSETRITMADFSKKPIRKIQVGEYVLGMDSEGNVVPTKVLNTFNNGLTEDWLYIRGTRINMGRGNHYFSVKCTPNHMFWLSQKQKYIAAKELNEKDVVLLHRSEYDITNIQKQVLLGKLLGDGSLNIQNNHAWIEFRHKKEHQDYMNFCCAYLDELIQTSPSDTKSGWGSDMLRVWTTANYFIKKYFSDFKNKHGKKIIPNWVVDEATPITIAFWYMDDGSLTHNEGQEDRAAFAVCGFTENDINVLRKTLNKFNIKSSCFIDTEGYNRLRLDSENSDKLFLLIAPYIPKIMQYKLPERYRGNKAWMPHDKNLEYKSVMVEQKITSVEKWDYKKSNRSKYDIETETHNFFANSVLVHNSNSAIGMVLDSVAKENPDREVIVSSRKHPRKRGHDSIYERPYLTYQEGMDAMFNALFDHLSEYTEVVEDGAEVSSVVIYGEIFGSCVQKGFGYGCDRETDYLAFDILVNGQYLHTDEVQAICEEFDIPMAPILYRGPYSFKKMQEVAEGNTTLKDDHIREGIVLRPGKERTHPKIGRVIFKCKNPDYEAM